MKNCDSEQKSSHRFFCNNNVGGFGDNFLPFLFRLNCWFSARVFFLFSSILACFFSIWRGDNPANCLITSTSCVQNLCGNAIFHLSVVFDLFVLVWVRVCDFFQMIFFSQYIVRQHNLLDSRGTLFWFKLWPHCVKELGWKISASLSKYSNKQSTLRLLAKI